MNQTITIDGGVQIPRLKKKEEERKGGGAPLPWMTRTTGLSLAAKEAPQGAFSSLLWGLNGRGGLMQLLRVTVGQRLSAAEGTALLVGALGMAALLLMGFSAWLNNGLDSQAPTTRWGGEVANFASTGTSPEPYLVRPHPGELIADRAMLSEAANESADQDRLAPAEPASEPAPEVPAVPEAPATSLPEVSLPQEKPILSGKLSFGSNGAAFAGGASMGGGPRDLRDALAGSAAPRASFMTNPQSTLGTTSFKPRPMVARLNRAAKAANGRTTRAMGQLKMANDRSFAALGAGSEVGARTFAADAFDQRSSPNLGSPITGGGMSTDATAGPLGSGAPDLTQPSVGPGMNVTPYQDKVDDAKKGIDKAMMMKLLGLALLAMGGIMIAIGKSMGAVPPGPMLVKIGIALIVAGILMMVMAGKAKNDAQKKAKAVGEESGQKEQGAVINDCADQAVMPQRCIAKPIDIPTNDVQRAVAAERNATYDINNGGPIGAGAIR